MTSTMRQPAAHAQHARSDGDGVRAEQHEHEFVDVSLILLRLVTNFKAGVFLRSASAPESLDRICNFTCMLMQVCAVLSAAQVEHAH
eukprot:3075211-Rhodomonas_salina.1